MGKPALYLAMAAGAFRIIFPKLCSELGLDLFRFLDLLLFLPAAWLGLGSLWRLRTFARTLPVLACVALAWVGVFYAGTESNRGYLIAAYYTLGLPIAALIVEERAWWMCARTYVVGNLAMLATVCWLESDPHNGFFATFLRLGFLRSADGTRWSSPDKLGGQLATAAVLALVLYLRHGTGRKRAAAPSADWSVHLISFAVLSLGVVLTASRGAFVAWGAGVGLLMVQALRVHDRNRARDLALGGLIGLALLVFVAVDSEYGPWQRLKARFGAHEELWTLCGRTEIWTSAYEAWTDDWKTFLIGTGTGEADEAMGHYDRLAVEDDYGNLRRNAHSLYVEWGLSHGMVGLVLGGCLLWTMTRQAYRLDRADGVLARQAIFACVGLFAMTGIVHRWPGWIASSSLILAMLTDRRAAAGRTPRPSELEEPKDMGNGERLLPHSLNVRKRSPHAAVATSGGRLPLPSPVSGEGGERSEPGEGGRELVQTAVSKANPLTPGPPSASGRGEQDSPSPEMSEGRRLA